MDRIWGIWGSYYNIPKAIFYLLMGDYTSVGARSSQTQLPQKLPNSSPESHESVLLGQEDHRIPELPVGGVSCPGLGLRTPNQFWPFHSSLRCSMVLRKKKRLKGSIPITNSQLAFLHSFPGRQNLPTVKMCEHDTVPNEHCSKRTLWLMPAGKSTLNPRSA